MILLDRLNNTGEIRGIFRGKVHLAILNTKLPQRTVSVTGDANDTQKGVVGRTDGRHQHVAGAKDTVESGGDGMRAVDEVDTDHGVLDAKDIRIDFSQFFPAQVVIAVTGGRLKVGIRNFVSLECGKNFFCVEGRNLVNEGKLFGQSSLGLGAKGANTVAYL